MHAQIMNELNLNFRTGSFMICTGTVYVKRRETSFIRDQIKHVSRKYKVYTYKGIS